MQLKTWAVERNRFSEQFEHDYKQVSQAIEVLQPLQQVKQLFLNLNKQIAGNKAEHMMMRRKSKEQSPIWKSTMLKTSRWQDWQMFSI